MTCSNELMQVCGHQLKLKQKSVNGGHAYVSKVQVLKHICIYRPTCWASSCTLGAHCSFVTISCCCDTQAAVDLDVYGSTLNTRSPSRSICCGGLQFLRLNSWLFEVGFEVVLICITSLVGLVFVCSVNNYFHVKNSIVNMWNHWP